MTIILYFLALFVGTIAPENSKVIPMEIYCPSEPAPECALIFSDILGMEVIPENMFADAFTRVLNKGLDCDVLLLADMTRPSTEKRLYVIDLRHKRLLLQTWVAHGEATGELYAEHFSNKSGSHQSSKGLFRIGEKIISPKHGDALLLYGLDGGLNDKAREREIILHSAPYVSADFIQEHGRLGRSWGCPSVDKAMMPTILKAVSGKSLLYIHTV